MYSSVLFLLLLLINSAFLDAWHKDPRSEVDSDDRRDQYQYNIKRQTGDHSIRRRMPEANQRGRDIRKKPTAHLTQLDEEDLDDEVVSVAIGPPPMRPKHFYERSTRNPPQYNKPLPNFAANLIKDVLSQIGKDFLTRQVSEDFVFGQYIGNAMRNLTSELKLRMQHEILELVVKYQLLDGEKSKGEKKKEKRVEMKVDRKGNDTEDGWSDFNNLAKIMGSSK